MHLNGLVVRSNSLVVKVLDSQSNDLVFKTNGSTQPFILSRSIKWVPGISGNLLVKSKLPPHSGSVALG